MYKYFEEQVEENFTSAGILREDDHKQICRLRHKDTGRYYVVRRQRGNAAVYQKLLPIKSIYLPEIYEAVQRDDEFLTLEEYITGDSMADLLEGACFSEKETYAIAMDICRALYTLHSLGIVHRDVKPENIVLRGDHAVLLDFDASRQIRKEGSKDTIILGTAGYAAPEQYGISQTDGRADIYALGVTMNIMLTGEHPSVRLTGGRLGRIISRCTMVHPGRRFGSVKSLMEALNR